MKGKKFSEVQLNTKELLNSEMGFRAFGGYSNISEFGVRAKAENGVVRVSTWAVQAYGENKQTNDREIDFDDYQKAWQEILQHGGLELNDCLECPATCMFTYELALAKENGSNELSVYGPEMVSDARYRAIIDAIEKLSGGRLRRAFA